MSLLISGEYENIIKELKLRGFNCIKTAKNPLLPRPVAYHADLQFLKINANTAFVLKNSDINISGYNIIKTDEYPQEKYPKDCLLNSLIINKTVYANKKAIDKALLKSLTDNNYIINEVAQGYARCSTCLVDDSHAITADKSIAKVLRQNDVDVLEISEGEIELKGYNYGFIGGASGKVGSNIIFTGNLSTHSFGSKIREYILSTGNNVVELGSNKLIDIGGILEI